MIYTAIEIAKYILDRCDYHGSPVSNFKLQLLVYLLWVGYYKQVGHYLFVDEFSAWKLGPVVPDVYYEYCAYAATPIRLNHNSFLVEADKAIANSIIDRYMPMQINELVDITHRPGSAWSNTFDKGNGNRKEIPFDLIIALDCKSHIVG